jgi:hypothetical protein
LIAFRSISVMAASRGTRVRCGYSLTYTQDYKIRSSTEMLPRVARE